MRQTQEVVTNVVALATTGDEGTDRECNGRKQNLQARRCNRPGRRDRELRRERDSLPVGWAYRGY